MNRRGFLSKLAAALLYPFQTHTMPYPESAHPYGINLDETQTFVQPGSPERIVVYFDALCATESGYDFVFLYDAADNPVGKPAGYSGVELAGLIIAVQGDTIKVRLTSDGSLQYYGYKVTNVATPTASGRLAAIHVYQSGSYLTERDVDGNWSQGTPFAAAADSGGGISPGNMPSDYPNNLGAIGSGSPTIYWLGNGLPTAPLPFTRSNPIAGDTGVFWEGYWDRAGGGWWANGAWYTLLPCFNYNAGVNDSYRWAMLKSVAYEGGDTAWPNLWTEMDQGNSPSHPTRIGNQERAAIRWDGTSTVIDLFDRVEGTPNSNCLYTYDLDTDTWSAAYGVADFGAPVVIGLHGDVGNNIFRFPNDDIGVVYSIGNVIYYRLYVRATDSWAAAVTVKTHGASDARVCTMIPDSSKELLHVFTINKTSGLEAAYHAVPHTAAPVADAFVWNTYTPDAFGHGTMFDGQIAVPFDDYDENMVWLAPSTGGATTFTAEILPRPIHTSGTIDTGTPSCATLFFIPTPVAPAGGGNFAYFGSPSFGISKSTQGHGWFT